MQVPIHSQVLQVACCAVQASIRTVWPNHSLKLSANGVPRRCRQLSSNVRPHTNIVAVADSQKSSSP